MHERCDEETRGALIPQRASGEAHCAANVHGVGEHVEWEAFDTMVHQNAEIISEVRACYSITSLMMVVD